MASKGIRLFARRRPVLQQIYVCQRCHSYATAPSGVHSAPPLLLKLRSDLKTAMKEKDTDRLNVLRSILTEITNSAKTSNPIKTDVQLLSLLRKRQSAAKDAETEFQAAGRKDLVEREEAQAAVLNQYADAVETMSDSDIQDAVNKVIEEIKSQAQKLNMGDVLKKLLAPGGILDGKPVERSEVARIVKQAIGQ